jgi:pimeloyl-ACP methyl ester carboxylesterase
MPFQISRRTALGLISVAAFTPDLFAATNQLAVTTASGRISNVTVWRARGKRHGTILFSHGALSAPAHYPDLIGSWVQAGYDVFAPLHVDSTEHPDTANYKGFATWRARIEDMRALALQMTDKHYVAAGHSFGALVALTLGGASAIPPEGIEGSLRDSNVRAVVAFSPPPPIPTLIEASGYATLAVPALIQTGDRDLPPGVTDPDGWKLHLAAYDATAAGGNRYALVLGGVDHYFGGLICDSSKTGPDQSMQLHIAAELSTLFLNAYCADKYGARKKFDKHLSNSGPTQLLFK